MVLGMLQTMPITVDKGPFGVCMKVMPSVPTSNVFLHPGILIALLAGTLDAVAACGRHFYATGKGPASVFKFIASGVFGRPAFLGGAEMVLAGITFHYLIAAGWTMSYLILRTRFPAFRLNKYLAGTAWALVIWSVMTFVVLPLSRTPPIPLRPGGAAVAILILVACVGLPISLVFERFQTTGSVQ
jgi:hypothetical protein